MAKPINKSIRLSEEVYCRWEDPNEEQCMYDDESLIYDFLMEEYE